MTIQDGKQVTFDYTLTVDGQIVDSSEGKNPLRYTHGDGKLIPGLSKQLEGLRVGDEKGIAVTPDQAYGTIDPTAFQEVPKEKLPTTAELKVGTPLKFLGPEGQTMIVRIAEVKDNTIVVDFNHPLAGKTLNFQIKVVSVQ